MLLVVVLLSVKASETAWVGRGCGCGEAHIGSSCKVISINLRFGVLAAESEYWLLAPLVV